MARNVDKHRRGVSGLPAEETEKWGRNVARERYGELRHEDGAPSPEDRSQPQAAGDASAAGARPRGFENDTAGWVRGARGEPQTRNESAENRPNFDRRGRDGLPKRW